LAAFSPGQVPYDESRLISSRIRLLFDQFKKGDSMSRIFGAIRQAGYVVEDIDAALRHWTQVLGVGPFFRFSLEFEHYAHRGRPSQPKLEMAFGNSGELQIELIQQVNREPSGYRAFLDAHGPGLQHVATWAERYDDELVRLGSLGYAVDTVCKIKGRGRATLYQTEQHAGTLVEVMELLPITRERMETVRAAAQGWDGSLPIRTFTAAQSAIS
jgi:hypothetical protein